jgi:xanthine/uracil permease
MKRVALAYLGLALFAIAPILVALISGYVAHAFGCQVDEALDHACLIFGLDWGPLFSFLFISGWFFILTVPLSAILLIGLTIFLVVRKVRKRYAPS